MTIKSAPAKKTAPPPPGGFAGKLLRVDMTKGTYHQDALDRLKQESQFIIGGGKQPKVIEATPVGSSDGMKLYSTPPQK